MLRIHPAILAQAAATASAMLGGRFRFGVGTVSASTSTCSASTGRPASVRRAMLEEAIEVMRELWTGDVVTRHGAHYTVENARIYTTPVATIPVMVSAFGPEAAKLAARIGDGFMSTEPDAEPVEQYRAEGGAGPTMATIKVCWGPDEEPAKKTRPPAVGVERRARRVVAGALDAPALRGGGRARDPRVARREDPLRTRSRTPRRDDPEVHRRRLRRDPRVARSVAIKPGTSTSSPGRSRLGWAERLPACRHPSRSS